MSSVGGYIRVQATVAGLVNSVVNPLFDWLSWREAPPPIWGADGLVINFVITSLILSTLVGAFAVWGVRREMRAGRISAGGTPPRWLRRLPRRGWLAGLTLGAAAAVLIIAATWLLYSSGIATLALPSLLVVKSLYAGVLAFLVARWVILRQLQ